LSFGSVGVSTRLSRFSFQLLRERGVEMGENGAVSAEQATATELRWKLERQMKSGASWFFWIAGLSVINTLVVTFKGRWSFLVGLGATQFVAGIAGALAAELDPPTEAIIRILGVLISVGIAGVIVLLGIFARRGKKWGFVVGIALYALDTVLLILVASWASAAFHLFALFWIVVGLIGKNRLDKLERGEIDVSTLAQRPPLITKGPRPRSYWIRLGLVAGIVLLPLLFLLIMLLFMRQ
jgi:hypothetical protein